LSSRLLIVSNRLPVTLHIEAGEVRAVPSTGGLATGLRGPHERGEGLWFGWPGALSGSKGARREALATLQRQRLVPIELSANELEGYYNAIANGVLWPVCHYLVDRLPLQTPDWDVYRRVNERFADVVAAAWKPGDVIWVHDYQLMLVPDLLRRRLPDARIGFFFHIPFPSSEVFRVLPWREELLRGLLGADLVGFHTLAYVRHFAASLLRLLGLEIEVDRVLVDGREVRLTALPMGIDVRQFEQVAAEPSTVEEATTLRDPGGARLVLGVDRLDYTKGIPRRLLAFERLLERRKPADPPVQLLQIAVTSRGEVSEYRSFKRSVDEHVGRINGRFGTPGYTPIRYLNRGVDSRGVTALYRAADVMLVTPLRDGLNLVAKEFVAARIDGDGVLVLSEFAGVASELPDAIQFNPYDLDGSVAAIERALVMPEDERRRRMSALRETVCQHDVHSWVQTFLDELSAPPAAREEPRGDEAAATRAVAALRAAGRVLVVLDYDGTLIGFGPRPELVVPDAELRDLLGRLARHPDLDVHIVSGRSRAFLEQHFGALRLGLHGEHGGASRLPDESAWQLTGVSTPEWRERVRALLERVARHVPGSAVELKEQSVAFHYRQVEAEFGATIVKELRLHLLELLSNVAAAVVEGNRVLEIRPQGVHKGNAVARALAAASSRGPVGVLILGDDRTDEDMFGTAPPDAVTVQVGRGVRTTSARFGIRDPAAARALLRTLLP
jgi:trehalose 6-phosphate synthase/phosphatase